MKSYVIGDDVLADTGKYLLYDGHGSTRILADSAGSVTDRYSYDAYGQMLGGNPNVTAPAATDMLYSGEQFDTNLQMNYHRARYYDMQAGIWNRLDPFSGNHSDPQSLHKYAYCHGDPVNSIDATGMAATLSEVTAFVGIGFTFLGLLGAAIAPAQSRARDLSFAVINFGVPLVLAGVGGVALGVVVTLLGILVAVPSFFMDLVGILVSPVADNIQRRDAVRLLMQIVMSSFADDNREFFDSGEIYVNFGEAAISKKLKI